MTNGRTIRNAVRKMWKKLVMGCTEEMKTILNLSPWSASRSRIKIGPPEQESKRSANYF
jgi:hypothetical protein